MIFITSIKAMHVTEPLGRGFEIRDGCFLTNDKNLIQRKVPQPARLGMGQEFIDLVDTGLAIYWEGDTPSDASLAAGDVAALDNWLLELRTFYQALWLIKDNAVNNELAFLFYQHPAYNDTACCRNFLTNALTTADGNAPTTKFSLDELRQARSHFQDALFPLTFQDAISEKLKPGSAPTFPFKVGAAKGRPRPLRFHLFLSGARTLPEVDLKISMYMTCLEILFSTSASEIAHKLSERVAFYLGKDSAERKEIFKALKRAYDIRSKIVHGDEIKVTDEVPTTSVAVDQVLRRTFLKMISDPENQSLFLRSSKALEEYLTDLTLGAGGPAPSPKPPN